MFDAACKYMASRTTTRVTIPSDERDTQCLQQLQFAEASSAPEITMIHPLLVGYFGNVGHSSIPQISKAIDVDEVLAVLRKYTDVDDDGNRVIASPQDLEQDFTDRWLGKIEKANVYETSGYLICPWLGAGFNKGSIRFICELYEDLGMRIFDPGNNVYYSPQDLDKIEEEYYRVIKRGIQ